MTIVDQLLTKIDQARASLAAIDASLEEVEALLKRFALATLEITFLESREAMVPRSKVLSASHVTGKAVKNARRHIRRALDALERQRAVIAGPSPFGGDAVEELGRTLK